MNRCSVCDHESRDEIEAHLRAGKSLRLVSRATGISKDSLFRHMRNHAVLALSEAIERRDAEEGDGTADDELGDLRASLLLMLEVAMSKGDFTRATALARELRQTLIELDKQEAARRLRGDGPTGPPTLHVTYDDPVFHTERLTDGERAAFERLLAKVTAGYEETFESIAALDHEIRKLEQELGSSAPLFDLKKLDAGDRIELERILAKALGDTRELPEAGEDGSLGDTIEAVVVEPDEPDEEEEELINGRD